MDKNEMVGGTRVYLFIRPSIPFAGGNHWKSILAEIEQQGGKVLEECSGHAVGRGELIVSAVLKDYGRVPELTIALQETYGLSLTVYPWENPTKFFQNSAPVTTNVAAGASAR